MPKPFPRTFEIEGTTLTDFGVITFSDPFIAEGHFFEGVDPINLSKESTLEAESLESQFIMQTIEVSLIFDISSHEQQLRTRVYRSIRRFLTQCGGSA